MSAPFTVWILDALFDKHGVPQMGTTGSSVGRVIVMRAETFKRLLSEHPSLATAEFWIGSYHEDEPERTPTQEDAT